MSLFFLFLVIVGGVVLRRVRVLHGREHIRAEDFQIILGNPHAFHHLVPLRQPDFAGATEA